MLPYYQYGIRMASTGMGRFSHLVIPILSSIFDWYYTIDTGQVGSLIMLCIDTSHPPIFQSNIGTNLPVPESTHCLLHCGLQIRFVISLFLQPITFFSLVASPALKTQFTVCCITGVTGQWEYRGPFQAFGSIARTEGLRGLFRGVGPTMQRAALLNAAQIPSYDHTKYTLISSGLMHEGISCHLVSSMTAGLVTAVVMSPIDLIKTRLVSPD